MSDMRRCLERQEQEIKERRRRRAKEKRMQQEDDEQVAMVVSMLDLSTQGRQRGSQVGHGPNMDRHRHSRGKNSLEDYYIPNSVYSNVDFQGQYRMQPHLFNKAMHDVCNYDEYFGQKFLGSQNDLNMLGQSSVFNDVLRGQAPNITYEINNTVY
ncbi:unnamed protein product [Prunus brigantina]